MYQYVISNIDNVISDAIAHGIPVTLTVPFVSHDVELYSEEILKKFLLNIGQDNLYSSLVYCLRELVTNAQKANIKRIYFESKNIDIHNSEEYNHAMSNFKEVYENLDYYNRLLLECNYYIRISYRYTHGKFCVVVENNVAMNAIEQQRAYSKITRARNFTVEDMGLVLDLSEGAGLGLIIISLMLKKISNNNKHSLIIDVINGITIVTISIQVFSKQIVNPILVQLPHYNIVLSDMHTETTALTTIIHALVQGKQWHAIKNSSTLSKILFSNPVSYGEILRILYSVSDEIMNDDMSMDIMCNSHTWVSKHYNTINQNIEKIHYSDEINTCIQKLWQEAFSVASYTYILLRYVLKNTNKSMLELGYMAALFFNIGNIFIILNKDILRDAICNLKSDNQDFLIKQLDTHSMHMHITLYILNSWNFPQSIIFILSEYFNLNHPLVHIDKNIKNIIYSISLAHSIYHLDNNYRYYDSIQSFINDYFDLHSKEDLFALFDYCKHNFSQTVFTDSI